MEVPVMLSFGNAGGLRNFQLHEVQSTALLDDVLDQCGPANWRSNMSSLTVKISATKSGGFDKFSLRNSVSLVISRGKYSSTFPYCLPYLSFCHIQYPSMIFARNFK